MKYIQNASLNIIRNAVFLDGEVLLNGNDRFNNLSRVPGHKLAGQELTTIIDLIVNNYQKHIAMFPDNNPDVIFYAVIDSLLCDYFMKHGEPLKVAEIGCNSGKMSYHIAPLLAAFDPNADYICICDTIGNESNNSWLDIISQINAPEGLALLASDFTNTMLKDNYFDCTVINGKTLIKDPMKTIREAVRITNENGRIICFSYEQYLLDDTFNLYFNNKREWRFNDNKWVILQAEKKDYWGE